MKDSQKRLILKFITTAVFTFAFSILSFHFLPALSEEGSTQNIYKLCEPLTVEYDPIKGFYSIPNTVDGIIECLAEKSKEIINGDLVLTKSIQKRTISPSRPGSEYILNATNSRIQKPTPIGQLNVFYKSDQNTKNPSILDSDFNTRIDEYIDKIKHKIIKKLDVKTENSNCPKEVIFDGFKLFCVSQSTDITDISNKIQTLARNSFLLSAIKVGAVEKVEVETPYEEEQVPIIYDASAYTDNTNLEEGNDDGGNKYNNLVIATITTSDLNILSPQDVEALNGNTTTLKLVDLAFRYRDKIVRALDHHRLTQDCVSSAQLVDPGGQPLFCIKSWLGSNLSPNRRVDQAEVKIQSLKNKDIPPSSLGIVTVRSIRPTIEITDFRDILHDDQLTDSSVAILVNSESLSKNDSIITIVTPNDSVVGDTFLKGQTSPIKLAESYLDIIKTYISQDNASASVKFLGGLVPLKEFIADYHHKYEKKKQIEDLPDPEAIFEVQSAGEQFDANFRAWTISEKLNRYVKDGQYTFQVFYSQDPNGTLSKYEHCKPEDNDNAKNLTIESVFIGPEAIKDNNAFIMQMSAEDVLDSRSSQTSTKAQLLANACRYTERINKITKSYKNVLFKKQLMSLQNASLATIIFFVVVELFSSLALRLKAPHKLNNFIYSLLISLLSPILIYSLAISLDFSRGDIWNTLKSTVTYLPSYTIENIKKLKNIKILTIKNISSKNFKSILFSITLSLSLITFLLLRAGKSLVYSLNTAFLLLPLIVMLSMTLEYIYFFGYLEGEVEIVRRTNRFIMRIFIILSILFIWISYLKSLSYTHDFARLLDESINRGFRLSGYYISDNFSEILTIIVSSAFVVLISTVLIEKFINSQSRKNAAIALIWVVGIAFTIVSIAQHLPGAETPYFAGLSAFVLLAFSLSSQTLIADFITGIILIFFTEVDEGDWIEVCGICGELREQTVLVHRLRTSRNELLTIPNNIVFNSKVTNFTAARDSHELGPLVLSTAVTIGYDEPWSKIETLLLRCAWYVLVYMDIKPDDSDKGYGKRAPYVLQTALDDFYVKYELFIPVSDHKVFGPKDAPPSQRNPVPIPKIYSELHKRMQDEFAAAGVEILSPHFREVRSAKTLVIPDEYKPSSTN